MSYSHLYQNQHHLIQDSDTHANRLLIKLHLLSHSHFFELLESFRSTRFILSLLQSRLLVLPFLDFKPLLLLSV
jgi:hypothetical protein